jgi:F-type H+-transporting ATPase subunit b
MKRFLTGLLLFSVPLLAEEGGAGQPDMTIWKWLNFLILAGLIGWFAVKQGGPAFAGRKKEIADQLAAGERAKAEALAKSRAVDARLANLGADIATLRAESHDEREREAARLRHDFERETDRIRRQSEMEIESAGKMARIELQRFAAKLAVDLAEQKIRARMTPDAQSALLAGFLADFRQSGAGEKHAG